MLTLHWQDVWGTKRGLFKHRFAEAPEKEDNWSMRVSGHSLLTIKKSVFEGNADRGQQSPAGAHSYKLAWSFVAEDRRVPSLRSGQLLCPEPPPDTSPCAGKAAPSGFKCQLLSKFLSNWVQKHLHHCRELPPIRFFPLRSASAFLEGTWHFLKTSWKWKTGLQFRERQRWQLRLRKPISTADSISWVHLWCWQAVLLICKRYRNKATTSLGILTGQLRRQREGGG